MPLVETIRKAARSLLVEEMHYQALNPSAMQEILDGKRDGGPAMRALCRSIKDRNMIIHELTYRLEGCIHLEPSDMVRAGDEDAIRRGRALLVGLETQQGFN
jgi:hypothetical protein